jgi:hypothetical protein
MQILKGVPYGQEIEGMTRHIFLEGSDEDPADFFWSIARPRAEFGANDEGGESACAISLTVKEWIRYLNDGVLSQVQHC